MLIEGRVPRDLLCGVATLLAVFSASPAIAQVAQGSGLDGDWVRKESTYDPNDGMRIRVAGEKATLTFTPPTGHRGFQVGQVLWQDILPTRRARVRGSDGNYYPATILLIGPDRLHVDIDHTGPGNDQSWRRAGPSVDGDWILVGPAGGSGEGIRIRVAGDEASIRYLPAEAPRSYRVGSKLWKNIGDEGTVQVLGIDGGYHPGVLTLDGTDIVRVASGTIGSQVWARPERADRARNDQGSAGPALTTVEGLVYDDADGDGVYDPGEPGVPGIRIAVVDNETGVPLRLADGSVAELSTDEAGRFSYSAAGPIDLGFRPWDPDSATEAHPYGQLQSAPTLWRVQVPGGSSVRGANFGI